MHLFERVKFVAKAAEKSGRLLHDEIGVNLHTYKGYLSLKRQDLLWRLLPKILEAFPEFSREWLYFGKEPITLVQNDSSMVELPVCGNESASPSTPPSSSDLEAQNSKLLSEINDLKSKIIDLQEELLSVHRGRRQERRAYGTGTTIANGPTTVVLS